MLVISGQVKRADLKGERGVRQMGVQEVDIVAMARPITKYAVTVTEPLAIRYHLEKARAPRAHRPAGAGLDRHPAGRAGSDDRRRERFTGSTPPPTTGGARGLCGRTGSRRAPGDRAARMRRNVPWS